MKEKPVLPTNVKKPLCFVLMPFVQVTPRGSASKYKAWGKPELDTIYDLYCSIIEKDGYLVRRSEGAGDILRDIVLDLDRAELVVADLTSLNPNVMYELGIRHGFTKKTILCTQDIAELPFDLRSYHCIEYGWITKAEKNKLEEDIRRTIKTIRDNPDTKFGPVHSHLGAKHLAIQDEEKKATVRKLSALEAELQHIWSSIKDVHKMIQRLYPDAFEKISTGWRLHAENLDLHSPNAVWAEAQTEWSTVYPAIDLFLSTRYVPDQFDHYGDILAFTRILGSFRFRMGRSDRSLANFLTMRTMMDALTDDLPVIFRAVEADQYGQDLHLASRGIFEELSKKEAEEGKKAQKVKKRVRQAPISRRASKK